MLIAPPRADSAGGAVGVAGKPPEHSESSDVPRGVPAEGEWRAAQRKGSTMRGFARQGGPLSAAAPARPLDFAAGNLGEFDAEDDF
eukprot:2203464-Alexandrium_andersonii.AAC.1